MLYFGIISQYDPTVDLKIHVGHWPIFHGPAILPYILKTIWCMNIILWDYESVWHDIWPQNKCRLLWFCLISWRLFDISIPYFGIMSQYDPMFNLKIFVGHCDLYFMVQWFCLISWKPMSGWTSYYESVWLDIWPQNIWLSLWPIFHGPLNVPCIFKTVWCMNIILWNYESVWHNIFHGPVFLPYILLAHLSRRLTRWAYRMGLEPASVRACVHTFKHEYLRDQQADYNQTLSEASLGWGKSCIRFWCRSDQNSGFHGNG